jgi:NADH:ubiquinone oxidoreductase subunit 6 (subunit J)
MVFSLLLTYLSAAVILFLLEIEFIAFLFIIIQSSAVVVLFTFTLMLFSIHFIEHRVIGKEAFYILGAVLPWTWISSKTLISIPSEVNYIEQFVGIPSPDIFFVGTLFTHYSAFVVVLTLILLLTTFLISHITN